MPDTADLAIDITGADKTYKGFLGRKGVHALRGVDLRVHRGEVFGLLGPNGAGKSTLVKILMTVIRPTACRGAVLGNPVAHKPTLARVGYLPEHHRFPDYLKGWQILDFYGAMAGVTRKQRRLRIPKLLELVGMDEWGNTRIRQYSKGMRQRVGLAQALMNDPELVLLDEPTDGVDPVGRRDIRAICQRLREEGRTVFINSHLLSELEMVCDRVAIMVKGRVARQGTIDELTADQRHYEIELAASAEPSAATAALHDALPTLGLATLPPAGQSPSRGSLPTGEWVELSHATLRVGTDNPETIRPLLAALIQRGHTVKTVRAHRPSLEDLFMAAVTDPDTGKALAPGAHSDKAAKKGARQ